MNHLTCILSEFMDGCVCCTDRSLSNSVQLHIESSVQVGEVHRQIRMVRALLPLTWHNGVMRGQSMSHSLRNVSLGAARGVSAEEGAYLIDGYSISFFDD